MFRLVVFAWGIIVKWIKKSHRPVHFFNKMLYVKCDCKSHHIVVLCMLCMRNESNVILFISCSLFWGGALVFLWGAEAPASPSLAPPMFQTCIHFFVLPNTKEDMLKKVCNQAVWGHQ